VNPLPIKLRVSSPWAYLSAIRAASQHCRRVDAGIHGLLLIVTILISVSSVIVRTLRRHRHWEEDSERHYKGTHVVRTQLLATVAQDRHRCTRVHDL
jgi:hypothetical protein